MRIAAALLTLLAAVAPAFAQEGAGETGTFGAWTAACDSTGYCEATNAILDPARDGPRYVLSVGRHAQQSYWELSLDTPYTPADPWSDFVVSVDGNSTTFSLSPQVGAYGSSTRFYFLGDGVQQTMDRMMPGSMIDIAFTDEQSTPQTVKFSLEGLTAALIWIDEKQHRIGSERVASAPPYGLVPAGAGQVAPDIPLALLNRHRADPDCQPLEELANGSDIVTADLGDGQTLYLLPCQSGAYNFAQKVYVGSREDFYDPQFFADYQPEVGWLGTPYIWNGDFDPADKSLHSFAKARGVGDCGTIGTWSWNGYMFVLTELRSRGCSDDIDPEAEIPEFPIVYQGPPAAAAPTP